jgi:hypothetical protein
MTTGEVRLPRSLTDPSIVYAPTGLGRRTYLSLSDLGIAPSTGRRLRAQPQRELLQVLNFEIDPPCPCVAL